MKRLLLAAAGLAVIAGPMAASAQPQQDERGGHNTQAPHQAPANRGPGRPAPQTFHAPQQNVQHFQQAPSQPRGGVNAHGNQGAHTTWRGPGTNGAPQGVPSGNGQYQHYGNSGQVQTYRGGQYQNHNGYAGQGQRSWSGSGIHLQGNWWRGRTGFNGYYGHRAGFWFAPGWGYYQVDPRWYGYDWVVGAVVPYDLQSYYISDPYAYGLPPAPYGCEWIFLGDQIVLIDLGSGQIVQIAGAY